MPTPPLWLETQALSEAVHAMAQTNGLSYEELRALLVLLGLVIGSNETSHVRCLQRISDIVEKQRGDIVGAVAEEQRRLGPSRFGVAGPKPAAKQEAMRWDETQGQ